VRRLAGPISPSCLQMFINLHSKLITYIKYIGSLPALIRVYILRTATDGRDNRQTSSNYSKQFYVSNDRFSQFSVQEANGVTCIYACLSLCVASSSLSKKPNCECVAASSRRIESVRGTSKSNSKGNTLGCQASLFSVRVLKQTIALLQSHDNRGQWGR
jgi:hypothetical protein